jgi:hypothetical protein
MHRGGQDSGEQAEVRQQVGKGGGAQEWLMLSARISGLYGEWQQVGLCCTIVPFYYSTAVRPQLP